jgi:hypothetical protein
MLLLDWFSSSYTSGKAPVFDHSFLEEIPLRLLHHFHVLSRRSLA